MLARIALCGTFGLSNQEAAEVCNSIEKMRLREIQNDMERNSGRSDASRAHWVHRNFPVSATRAEELVNLAKDMGAK